MASKPSGGSSLGIRCFLPIGLGVTLGLMEKKMETTIMGYIGIIWVYIGVLPHPVIVTVRDSKDYVFLFYHENENAYYVTIAGWGVHLRHLFFGWSL